MSQKNRPIAVTAELVPSLIYTAINDCAPSAYQPLYATSPTI